MKCPDCGFGNPDDMHLCMYCGAGLTGDSSQEEVGLHAAARSHVDEKLSDDEFDLIESLANRQWSEPFSAAESAVIQRYHWLYEEFMERYGQGLFISSLTDDTDWHEEAFDDDDTPNDDTSSALLLDHNVIEHIYFTGGLVGLFVSDASSIQTCIDRLNRDGYRVSIVLPATQTFAGWIVSGLLLVITLFLYTRLPGYLVLGERVTLPHQTVRD